MKLRGGFVSNSSSSSFVICKNFITKEQRDQLVLFYNSPEFREIAYDDNGLNIFENEKYLAFNCYGGMEELINFMIDELGLSDNEFLQIYL